jgi:hypothetical protein
MADMPDFNKIISLLGEAIGLLSKHDPEEAQRLFIEVSEVLLKE